jgi:YD repeat-containing protein
LCSEELVWSYERNGLGQVEAVVDPRGARVERTPSLAGWSLAEEAASGGVVFRSSRTFDGLGQVLTEEDANGVVSRQERDGLGRPLSSWVLGVGASAELPTGSWTYQSASAPAWVEAVSYRHVAPGAAPVSSRRWTVLDGRGEAWRTVAGLSGPDAFTVVESQASAVSALSVRREPWEVAVFDPLEVRPTSGDLDSWRWQDALGWGSRSWSASTGWVVQTHPEPGVVRTEDEEGRVREEVYDAWGRLEAVFEGDLSAPLVRTALYRWDVRGRPQSFEDSQGTVWSWSWDGAGRLRESRRGAAGGSPEVLQTLSYTGPLPTSRWELGVEVERWSYDGLGRGAWPLT